MNKHRATYSNAIKCVQWFQAEIIEAYSESGADCTVVAVRGGFTGGGCSSAYTTPLPPPSSPSWQHQSSVQYPLLVKFYIMQIDNQENCSTTLLCSFNGLFSRTTWVRWHQKGRTILGFNREMMRWQWHQLDHANHLHICTLPVQIICTSSVIFQYYNSFQY